MNLRSPKIPQSCYLLRGRVRSQACCSVADRDLLRDGSARNRSGRLFDLMLPRIYVFVSFIYKRLYFLKSEVPSTKGRSHPTQGRLTARRSDTTAGRRASGGRRWCHCLCASEKGLGSLKAPLRVQRGSWHRPLLWT